MLSGAPAPSEVPAVTASAEEARISQAKQPSLSPDSVALPSSAEASAAALLARLGSPKRAPRFDPAEGTLEEAALSASSLSSSLSRTAAAKESHALALMRSRALRAEQFLAAAQAREETSLLLAAPLSTPSVSEGDGLVGLHPPKHSKHPVIRALPPSHAPTRTSVTGIAEVTPASTTPLPTPLPPPLNAPLQTALNPFHQARTLARADLSTAPAEAATLGNSVAMQAQLIKARQVLSQATAPPPLRASSPSPPTLPFTTTASSTVAPHVPYALMPSTPVQSPSPPPAALPAPAPLFSVRTAATQPSSATALLLERARMLSNALPVLSLSHPHPSHLFTAPVPTWGALGASTSASGADNEEGISLSFARL